MLPLASYTPALFAALVACVLSSVACSRTPAAGRAAVDGKALFAQACAKCHGTDGTGGLPTVANGPKPVDLTSDAWQESRSDGELISAIRDGRGAMPPFADVLTAEQVHALAAHLRTLRRR